MRGWLSRRAGGGPWGATGRAADRTKGPVGGKELRAVLVRDARGVGGGSLKGSTAAGTDNRLKDWRCWGGLGAPQNAR